MMYLLERLRVFSPDVLYTMPYFSWERLIVFAMALAIMLAFGKSMGAWGRAAFAFSRVLPYSRKFDREQLAKFALGRIHFGLIFVPFAGGLFSSAILFVPAGVADLLVNGFTSFQALDLGGWIALAAIAIALWMALTMVLFGIAGYGLIIGLLDGLVYLSYVGVAFIVGWAIGPLAILAFFKARDLRSGINIFSHIWLFIAAPFNAIRIILVPQAKAAAPGGRSGFSLSSLSVGSALRSLDKDH